MTDDETLMLDVARAAVARCRLFHDRTDNGRAAYIDAEKRLYRLYHMLTPEQITACVECVKKQVTE